MSVKFENICYKIGKDSVMDKIFLRLNGLIRWSNNTQ